MKVHSLVPCPDTPDQASPEVTRILLAERPDARRAHVSAELSASGYDVVVAGCREDVLDAFGSVLLGELAPIDLVLDDLGCVDAIDGLHGSCGPVAVVPAQGMTSSCLADIVLGLQLSRRPGAGQSPHW
jgi:hypothetical protein